MLAEAGVRVSLFIDPEPSQIEAARAVGADDLVWSDGDAAEIYTCGNDGDCTGDIRNMGDASGVIGPNLDDTSLSTEQIEAQIRSGGGAMPPYEGQLSDAQITSLAELISSN